MRLPELKIIDEKKASEISDKLKKEGKKIAFTNGCYDIIHVGHIKTFFEAKNYADVLFVGINSDESIKKLKGEKRPVIPLGYRMIIVASCEAVDFVVPFNEDTPETLIRLIRPDILLKGKDWDENNIIGADFVRSYGGKVIRVDLVENVSTTQIIRKILELYREE